MPRKGRGGAREGSAQTAYSNRTDLNKRGPEPITTAPGQTYGQATMQREAQQAVPMAGVQVPPAAPAMQAAPASAAPAMQGTPDVPGQPVSMASAAPEPGSVDLFAPAEHPPPTNNDFLSPTRDPQAPGMAMQRIASVLQDAATSPYATRQVQELAAVARSIA